MVYGLINLKIKDNTKITNDIIIEGLGIEIPSDIPDDSIINIDDFELFWVEYMKKGDLYNLLHNGAMKIISIDSDGNEYELNEDEYETFFINLMTNYGYSPSRYNGGLIEKGSIHDGGKLIKIYNTNNDVAIDSSNSDEIHIKLDMFFDNNNSLIFLGNNIIKILNNSMLKLSESSILEFYKYYDPSNTISLDINNIYPTSAYNYKHYLNINFLDDGNLKFNMYRDGLKNHNFILKYSSYTDIDINFDFLNNEYIDNIDFIFSDYYFEFKFHESHDDKYLTIHFHHPDLHTEDIELGYDLNNIDSKNYNKIYLKGGYNNKEIGLYSSVLNDHDLKLLFDLSGSSNQISLFDGNYRNILFFDISSDTDKFGMKLTKRTVNSNNYINLNLFKDGDPNVYGSIDNLKYLFGYGDNLILNFDLDINSNPVLKIENSDGSKFIHFGLDDGSGRRYIKGNDTYHVLLPTSRNVDLNNISLSNFSSSEDGHLAIWDQTNGWLKSAGGSFDQLFSAKTVGELSDGNNYFNKINDDLDDINNGSTYGKVRLSNINNGYIDKLVDSSGNTHVDGSSGDIKFYNNLLIYDTGGNYFRFYKNGDNPEIDINNTSGKFTVTNGTHTTTLFSLNRDIDIDNLFDISYNTLDDILDGTNYEKVRGTNVNNGYIDRLIDSSGITRLYTDGSFNYCNLDFRVDGRLLYLYYDYLYLNYDKDSDREYGLFRYGNQSTFMSTLYIGVNTTDNYVFNILESIVHSNESKDSYVSLKSHVIDDNDGTLSHGILLRAESLYNNTNSAFNIYNTRGDEGIIDNLLYSFDLFRFNIYDKKFRFELDSSNIYDFYIESDGAGGSRVRSDYNGNVLFRLNDHDIRLYNLDIVIDRGNVYKFRGSSTSEEVSLKLLDNNISGIIDIHLPSNLSGNYSSGLVVPTFDKSQLSSVGKGKILILRNNSLDDDQQKGVIAYSDRVIDDLIPRGHYWFFLVQSSSNEYLRPKKGYKHVTHKIEITHLYASANVPSGSGKYIDIILYKNGSSTGLHVKLDSINDEGVATPSSSIIYDTSDKIQCYIEVNGFGFTDQATNITAVVYYKYNYS